VYSSVIKLVKEILFNSPLRKYFFPRYLYNFSAPQLCFLCQCLEDTRDVEGSVAEIGCADGTATVFLNKYMSARAIEKNYYAVDTFSGFVAKDIDYEVSNRGKAKNLFWGFERNKKKWFDGTMDLNGITGVQTIEADVNEFDLKELGPLSFVLLDVDLYRPMKKALPELYEVLTPGGMIVVDDCDPSDERWDGSEQAYREFMNSIDEPERIVHKKLGIVIKADLEHAS